MLATRTCFRVLTVVVAWAIADDLSAADSAHSGALRSSLGSEVPQLWRYANSTSSSVAGGSGRVVLMDEVVARAKRHAGARIGLPMPDGSRLEFVYLRSEEQGAQVWTWIGETDRGERAIISFGPGTVYGKVERHHDTPVLLDSKNGVTYLHEGPDRKALDGDLRLDLSRSDVLDPPWVPKAMSPEAGYRVTGGTVTVDLVVGMTTGFVADQGSLAAAQTRLAQLVAIANSGLERGLVDHRLRLVHSLQVNYSDLTSNRTALEAVSGVSCNPTCVSAPVPIGLQPLRAARDNHGGDLAVLLRRYREPQQQGCGSAWLLGGGGFPIDTTDAPYGYSVVSEGSDLDENTGLTFLCRDSTLAHEIGHNMGQAHNQQDAADSGTHSYAYGYRETSSTGFYTIMALRLPNSSQFAIDYFGNPAITYAATGRPTGSATANNGRSLQLSMPLVAQFRAEVQAGVPIFSNGFESP